jgi:hypothetical protein
MHDKNIPMTAGREAAFYALLSAAKAVLEGPFEREASEYADGLFSQLQDAVDGGERALRQEGEK